MPPSASSSKPFASVGYRFPAMVHCPTCDASQSMHINGVKPALYCGKDTIFYQCTKCGNETTERVTSEEAPPEGSEVQWLSLK
jgi:C4-type Zn-finger protein